MAGPRRKDIADAPRPKRTDDYRGPRRPVPAGATAGRPMVAIVGRPNVGKSTLFNKLARKRLAIVEDVPGVTRDRHYADARVRGREYVLVDTGGFDPESDDPMKSGINEHVQMALAECDVVICVFDATTDPAPADREAVRLLRGAGKPVLFTANKSDGEKQALDSVSYYELGLERVFPVSALHGRGIGDLEDALMAALPEAIPVPEINLDVPRVAIVGRPNAGKSSLVNRLTGEDRQLVDSRPGTTVDAVDTLLQKDSHRFILTDTAGIRRKRSVDNRGVEALSVYQAIRAMERSDVVVLMIDAHAGVGEQDAKIAGLAVDRGNALVVGINKGDLLSREELRAARIRTQEILAFAPWATVVPLSAKKGRGVNKLLEAVARAGKSHRQRVTTSHLNRFFEEVVERQPPPSMKSRSVRIYYVTQAAVCPPTFVVVTNHPDYVHFSYQRFLINQIRERFGFEGTPIRVRYRGKDKKKKK